MQIDAIATKGRRVQEAIESSAWVSNIVYLHHFTKGLIQFAFIIIFNLKIERGEDVKKEIT